MIAVAAILPISLFRRVESALAGAADVRLCATTSEASIALRARSKRALIVDPTSVSESTLFALAVAAADAGASIVAYSAMEKISCSRILELARRWETEVVFLGAEQEREILSRAIDPARGLSVAARVLRDLASPLARLQGLQLRSASLSLFGWLPVPASVHDFYALSEGTDRTCERHLRRVGMRPGIRLLCCARVARAWEGLRRDATSVGPAGERPGCENERKLRDDFRSLVGVPPARARRDFATPEFATKISSSAMR